MSQYMWTRINYKEEDILPEQYPMMSGENTSGTPYPWLYPGQKNSLTGESIVRYPVIYPSPCGGYVISYRGQHYLTKE